MAENELNELAELLRELEQTLLTLKATKETRFIGIGPVYGTDSKLHMVTSRHLDRGRRSALALSADGLHDIFAGG